MIQSVTSSNNQPRVHWVDFVAIAYLILPLVLFFYNFLSPYVALPALLLMTYMMYEIWFDTKRSVITYPAVFEVTTLVILVVIILYLSGSLSSLQQNGDWKKHYAIFNIINSAKMFPPNFAEGDPNWLRYSLGWHLTPAFISRWLGIESVRLISGLWTLLGLVLFFILITNRIEDRLKKVVIPVMFMLFSGMDYLGTTLTGYERGPKGHLEWWAGWIEYGSNITGIFWVPQHALSAWLGVALLIRQYQEPTLLPFLALIFVAITFWSPFSVIGLVPFALLILHRHGYEKLILNWRVSFSLLIIGLPVILYLFSGVSGMPKGLIWTETNRCVSPNNAPCFEFSAYLIFMLIELAMPALLLLIVTKKNRAFLWAAVLSLMIIPFYRLGINNDFGMRVSMAAIAVISIYLARLIAFGKRIYVVSALAILLFGLPTIVGEVKRPFVDDIITVGLEEYTFHDMLARKPGLQPQYFSAEPLWMLRSRPAGSDGFESLMK